MFSTERPTTWSDYFRIPRDAEFKIKKAKKTGEVQLLFNIKKSNFSLKMIANNKDFLPV